MSGVGSRLVGAVPGPWVEDAACGGKPDHLFFPTNEEQKDHGSSAFNAGKAICATCPVRDDCLDFAVSTDQRWGVWGGLTYQERRRQAFKQRASTTRRTA